MSEILGNICNRSIAIVIVAFFRDCGTILLVVLWRNFFQNLVFMFSFYPKKAEVVLKNFHNSELIGRRKLANPFLSNVFNLLPICLRYTLSFEWPDFGLKYLVTVTPKGQPATLKISVWTLTFLKQVVSLNHFSYMLIVTELLLWN